MFYPLLRRVGGLVGRDATVEQYIAEHEYILAQVTDHDRTGIASRTGFLGIAIFVLFLVGGFAIGWFAVSVA